MLLVGTYLHAVQLCLHLLLVMQEALFQEFHTLQCPGVNCKSHTMLKPWQAQAQWPATQVSMYCKFQCAVNLSYAWLLAQAMDAVEDGVQAQV